jgi:hypothetical protein
MVPCFSSEPFSVTKSLFYPINGHYILGLIVQGIDERTKPNRPATNEHDSDISKLRVFQACKSIAGRKVTSREDISHEAKLQLVDLVRGMQDGTVSQWHSHILGLGTVEQWAAKQYTLCTPGGVAVHTIKAFPTGDREWRYYHVALLEFLHRQAKFANSACKFMAHDEVRFRCLMATKDMQLAMK